MTLPAIARSSDADEPRVIAGKYRLESLLGEGGMGSIWRAFNLQLEVPVAIKLLRPGLDQDELSERLRVEARAAAKLVHPSIVRVYDIGEAESGEPFIVMELLSGESLGDLLEAGPLPPSNAVQLLLPIAEALSLAHSRGVVHRDLKPDNIFLAREGDAMQPKLLDFGIAKVTSAAAGGVVLTQTGVLLGSPDYMSPEQACGRSDIDARSDIWSFCVVLYEAISGTSPFAGETTQSVLRSVVYTDPVPLDALVDVDPRLAQLVQSGLAKDRDRRPESSFELGQQLAAWLFEQGVQEDVTGASLESKWLGRSTDTLLLTVPQSIGGPRAQHDHATLVSLAKPHHASMDSLDSVEQDVIVEADAAPLSAPRRRRSWTPTALAACAILLGCVGWASTKGFHGSIPGLDSISIPAVAAAAEAAVEPAPTPPPAMYAQSTAAPVPLEPDVLEALQHSVPRPPKLDDLPAPAAPAAAPNPAPLPVQLASSIARPQTRMAPTAASPALPQALPTRDPAQDLLQPY